jgi:hypothetical protein
MTSTRAKWTIAKRPVDLGLDMVGERGLQLLKLGQRFRILLQRDGHVQGGDHRTLLLSPSASGPAFGPDALAS